MQTLDFLINIAYFTKKKKESEKSMLWKRRKKFTVLHEV